MAVLALLLLRGLSSCSKQGLLFVGVQGFSLWWLLLLRSTGSRAVSVAPQHMESSWTRDWACVSCIDRQILNHWITRNILMVLFSFNSMLLHNPAFIFAREWQSEFKTGGRGQDSVLKGLAWLWIFKMAPHLLQIPWALPLGQTCGCP